MYCLITVHIINMYFAIRLHPYSYLRTHTNDLLHLRYISLCVQSVDEHLPVGGRDKTSDNVDESGLSRPIVTTV